MLKRKLLFSKLFKRWILSTSLFWELKFEQDWTVDVEMPSRPKRIYKNKHFPEFVITEITSHVDYFKPKQQVVNKFYSDYKNNKLINNKLCLV